MKQKPFPTQNENYLLAFGAGIAFVAILDGFGSRLFAYGLGLIIIGYLGYQSMYSHPRNRRSKQ